MMAIARQHDETLTLTAAQEMLGVSRTTLWRIIRSYQIQTLTDVLDTRIKLVKKSDIERVLEDAEKVRRGIAA
ncbi:MAG: helix-turn-helix domain-containing protein [Acidobacteria bacterium]|nr:helix-turn-helix domain-containing protein [Acidobacteriota bacterium]